MKKYLYLIGYAGVSVILYKAGQQWVVVPGIFGSWLLVGLLIE